jgi:hypothetical protein
MGREMAGSNSKAFISHNRKDKSFVRRLVSDLREHGVGFWLDEMEMGVGDSLSEKIQAGIGEAQHFIVVVSNNSIESRWVKTELAAALSMERASGETFVLPAVIDNCNPPPFLMDKIYADFRESYETGLLQLLKKLVGRKRIRDVVRIPAGTFLWSARNAPRQIEHSYYIDKTCVTEGDFFRFIQETGYAHPFYLVGNPPISRDSLLPVNYVSLADANAYCKWRSDIEGQRVRLPTAEEWEKASRGGDDRPYPWGDEGNLASQFWYCNSLEFVELENRGVKQRQAWDRFPQNVSPYGVHDMVGNVSEWTSSDFQGPHKPNDRVGMGMETRGGAFVLGLRWCTCFSAIPRLPGDRVEYIGFRCVTEQ